MNLAPPIVNAIAQERIRVSIVRDILRLKPREQIALFNLFESLNLGVNLQREFLENLYESSRRDATTIDEIIKGEPLASILADETKSAQERTALFRSRLRHLRYPKLASTEERFANLVKSLKLPPEIAITPPAYFEGDTYRVDIRFKTPEDLAERLAKIRSAITSPAIAEWFGIS